MKPLHLRHIDLRIQAEHAWLDALLSFAPDVRGLIICAAPNIGRLRDSRDNYASGILHDAGYATLLVSMLTPYEESRDPDLRYDVTLLGNRLNAVLTWLDQQPDLTGLPLGLLATGTVVAAGIRHLVRDPARISALVSRAGRPDLAGGDPLRRLSVPILLQVPGAAQDLLKPSQQAYAHLSGNKQWHEISNASAGFIEPGALESITREATDWFLQHLPARPLPPAAEDTPPA